MSETVLKINRRARSIDVSGDTPLLYVLRNDLGLDGPKFGCGLGQCGACTVLIDGAPARSCVTVVADIGDAEVVTLEGLGDREHPHPLQTAYIDQQAMQCGYCANGMIMTAAALLAQNPRPSEDEIRGALAGNLCRCGTHKRIIAAVKQAAEAGNAGK